MRERALVFGPHRGLVGILAEPDAARRCESKPAVVFWNAGVLHRVGPRRLFVDLARKLAEDGYFSLRFDLSGLGDSARRPQDPTSADRVTGDVLLALDHLREVTGIGRFVLIGLCSGADDAVRVAKQDDRVAGVALLDPFVFPTLGDYVSYYAPRVLNPRKWISRARSLASSALKRGGGEDEVQDGRMAVGMIRTLPTRAEYARTLAELVVRETAMLVVYTGEGVLTCDSRKFRRTFKEIDFRDLLEVEYLPHADHLFTLARVREEAMEMTFAWLERAFGTTAP